MLAKAAARACPTARPGAATCSTIVAAPMARGACQRSIGAHGGATCQLHGQAVSCHTRSSRLGGRTHANSVAARAAGDGGDDAPSTSGAAGRPGQQWQEGFVLENPLMSSTAEVFDTQGNRLAVSTLAKGKTVVGLLRHLGCALCWRQAANLAALKPKFEELGFKLVVVAIGYPEAAKELCEKLPFPADLLYLDPDMKIYTELHLNAGLKYFFNRDTLEGCRELGTDEGKSALARYSFIKPPNAQCTLQMGGLYVVDSGKLLYGHMDKGLGAHAPNDQVLAACATA